MPKERAVKYLGGSFSVMLGSDAYRANFDRIFRGKDSPVDAVAVRHLSRQDGEWYCTDCNATLAPSSDRVPREAIEAHSCSETPPADLVPCERCGQAHAPPCTM